MTINNNRGYQAILDLVSVRILSGVYTEGERIPSVRDMAVEMEVSPVTITRAYERLQQLEVIHAERGTGYYVSPGGVKRLKAERLERFKTQTIPELRQTLFLLGITHKELSEMLISN